MIVKANSAGVLGTGHYVPDKIVTNADMEKLVDTSDEMDSRSYGYQDTSFC